MKKIVYLSMLVAVFALNACKEDNDIFEESASIRLQNALNEYQELLASSTNGWFGDYYPEEDHKIGGYAMFLKFNSNGNVAVSCEIATNVPAGEERTSQWEMIAEQGPVLSFANYNPVMHYFSEPYASDVNGRMGDYEFVVMKASQDTIELKGKKHNNRFVLRRNTGNINPQTYFSGVAEFEDKLSEFGMFSFVLKGTRIGVTAVIDRTFSIGYQDEEAKLDKTVKVAYTFTPDGILLYEPFTFKDVTMQNFKWNAAEEKYVCTDPGVDAYFDVYFPEDYELRYGEFIGKWNMQYHGASTTTWANAVVEIVIKKKNATYTMICPEIFSFPGIEVAFDAQKGIISILNHNAAIDEATGYSIRICAYDRTAGYLNTSSTGPVGIVGNWNKDAGGARSVNFVDNKVWGTYHPNGLIFRLYNGSTSIGNFTDNIGGYRFNDITITKIED
ncbi:MAG: DUF4302 domain-containing protein [Dysgonamonadaceae bacterium]|nr:DUF4302 domain-containing protein [Dysgonamonadaceae bacterium]